MYHNFQYWVQFSRSRERGEGGKASDGVVKAPSNVCEKIMLMGQIVRVCTYTKGLCLWLYEYISCMSHNLTLAVW